MGGGGLVMRGDKQFQAGCLCCDRKIFMIGKRGNCLEKMGRKCIDVLPNSCVQYAADIVHSSSIPYRCVLVRPTKTPRSTRI